MRVWHVLALVMGLFLFTVVAPNYNSICDHARIHGIVVTQCGPSEDWIVR